MAAITAGLSATLHELAREWKQRCQLTPALLHSFTSRRAAADSHDLERCGSMVRRFHELRMTALSLAAQLRVCVADSPHTVHSCPPSTCVMQQQQQQHDEQPPPPLIPPPSHIPQSSPSSSSSSHSATDAPLLPLVCRACSSPALLACVHARCAFCCRLLMVYCPGHESRPSLVGARFAAVLDGSVNGGLRLTAQLGDRVYRGVVFTGPAAVRIQRTSMNAGTGTSSTSLTSSATTNGSSEAQQQAAKRQKASSSTTAILQHIAEPAANSNPAQPP